MMRRCIVDKCINSDNTILCHRFPKNRILAQKWQISLNLTDCALDTLISKYTVCCQHFDCTDYRNSLTNSLNATAVPKLQGINPRPYAGVRTKNARSDTEQHSPTYWAQIDDKHTSSLANGSDSVELLHRDDDADDATEIDDSLTSNPCSNDEICILPEELNPTDDLIQSIDGADFTMLDAAGCTMYMQYADENKQLDNTDESSAFILESRDNSGHSQEYRPSSTDSDVEVLASEGLFESQWSGTDRSAVVLNANTSDSAVSPCISYQSDLSIKTNEAAMTMLDTEFGHLDRFQLIEIIKNQSVRIQELESKLGTFKSAQEQFFIHFDAFRNTVCGIHI